MGGNVLRNLIPAAFFLLLYSACIHAGQVDRIKEGFMKYPSVSLLMEIKLKKDRSAESDSLYSVGGDPLGYKKDISEAIWLEIELRNMSNKVLKDLSLEYVIFGRPRSKKRVKGKYPALKKTIEIKPMKHNEERTIKTDSILFEHEIEYGRFSDFSGMRARGKKYSAYQVTVFYKGTPILLGKNR